MGMEYPESNWTLELSNGSRLCDKVKWTQSFTLNELSSNCEFQWVDNSDTIDLIGAFYLTLVSPSNLFYPSVVDSGHYLTKQVAAAGITISFTKSYTLSLEASVNLFGIQLISSSFDVLLNLFSFSFYTYKNSMMYYNDHAESCK